MIRSLRRVLPMLLLVVASRAWADAGDPTPLDPEAEARKTPLRISGAVTNEDPPERLRLAPPFMRDRRGDEVTTALFPLWFDRKSPKKVERFVLPYYFRRDAKLQADVFAGVFWSLRGPERNTFILGPLYTHHDHADWGGGLLPLFSTGKIDGHYHTLIPPLLTWIEGNDKKHRHIVGIYYDVQGEKSRWRGVAPLVWSKTDQDDGFTVVPPLFFRFTKDEPFAATTIVPPFYYSRDKDRQRWGLIPLLFRKTTEELKSTTVPFLFFNFARGPKRLRIVTPLMGYARDEHEKTWVTPLYQRKRGDKNLDAVAPFFAHTWDDRVKSEGLYFPPFYWDWQDPANRTRAVFPAFIHDHKEGISDFWLTPVFGHDKNYEEHSEHWWLAPTFFWMHDPKQRRFNILPLVFTKRSEKVNYTIAAPFWADMRRDDKRVHRLASFPFYWDFKDFKLQKRTQLGLPFYYRIDRGQTGTFDKVIFPFYYDFDYRNANTRYTVTFPFYGRIREGDRTRHFVLNSMYETRTNPDRDWQFHSFPFFARGGSHTSHWWSVFYGLAGYEQRGKHRRMHVLWLPIRLRDSQPQTAARAAKPKL